MVKRMTTFPWLMVSTPILYPPSYAFLFPTDFPFMGFNPFSWWFNKHLLSTCYVPGTVPEGQYFSNSSLTYRSGVLGPFREPWWCSCSNSHWVTSCRWLEIGHGGNIHSIENWQTLQIRTLLFPPKSWLLNIYQHTLDLVLNHILFQAERSSFTTGPADP